MSNLVGITIALPQEARALFGILGWSRSDKFPTKVERFQDVLAMVAISGQGASRAQEATRFLLKSNPVFVINMGVSGALVKGLQSGDLVVPDAITDTEKTINLESPLKKTLDSMIHSMGIRFNRGLLVTSRTTVNSPQDKKRLHEKTSAVAVDMEAFGVARACQAARVPFYAVKAVTDDSSQAIPAAITNCLGETGHISFSRFTITILTRPWLISSLIEMQRSFKAAILSLEQVKAILSANLTRQIMS